MSDSPPIFNPSSMPKLVEDIPEPKPSPYAKKAQKMHERLVATYRKPKR